MEEVKKRIYLDSANTTYVNREVLTEMMPTFNSVFGDPAANYSYGRDAKALVDLAKKRVANGINAEANEIYFTSCEEEANNWAILGIARANRKKGKHIITSKVEDASILLACKQLEAEGFEVTYVGCDEHGVVSLSQIMHAMRQDTILVSIQVANNHVGTIQHLNAIARTVAEKDIIFHCDATSAFGAFPLDVKVLPIDAMTISSEKIYGPKGAAALYVKNGTKIDAFVVGDSEDETKRAGTQNVASIVGFGKAVELAAENFATNTRKLKGARDYLVKGLMEKVEGVFLNGHNYQRVPHIANLQFDCVDNECLATLLDFDGIAVGVCGNRKNPSKTLLAMGKTLEEANSSVRFSISKNVTKDDLDFVVEKVASYVKKLREVSPLRRSSTKEGK